MQEFCASRLKLLVRIGKGTAEGPKLSLGSATVKFVEAFMHHLSGCGLIAAESADQTVELLMEAQPHVNFTDEQFDSMIDALTNSTTMEDR